MSPKQRKYKVGIVGCGAIGSRMAESICRDLRDQYQLSGLYDIDFKKAESLAARLGVKANIKYSLDGLIRSCGLMIEAVNAKTTRQIIRRALMAKRHVLAMSVGKLLHAQDLFGLAKTRQCALLLPSGAIAGIDAIKAASLASVKKIVLTTRKHLAGFHDNSYLRRKGVVLSRLKKTTTLFEGDVDTAVKLFPQNINVAATLALASQARDKITIRILTSPAYTTNSHEIEVTGDFGRIRTRTDNVVCPDNPKTSYLAVLSGIQTLRQFGRGLRIGT